MSNERDAVVLNFVIRMVVPMKREFGLSLDVQQFMHDQGYARGVLDQALTSRDQRLRDYAENVQRHLYGARDTAGPLPAPAAAAAAPAAAAPAPEGEVSEAELRARMLRRYTTGLR
jgi:hypothetical protein